MRLEVRLHTTPTLGYSTKSRLGTKRTARSMHREAQADEEVTKANVKKELNEAASLDDMDMEVISSRPVKRRGRLAASTQVLKAVAIPTQDPKTGLYHNRNTLSSRSPASTASLSSACERSSGYDTPGTSLAATPAESANKGELLFRVPSKPSSTTPLGRQNLILGLSSTGGKRKRKGTIEEPMKTDIIDSDAKLASALQAEEYDEDAMIQSKPVYRRRRRVQDSEDDIIGDSDDNSVDVDQRKIKKIRVSSRLPTRAARDSARKSIAQKASLGIADTEDSDLSAESEYLSELDSMDFDDESDGVDLLQPNDIAIAAAITAAPGTTPSANRARISRRRGRHVNRNMDQIAQQWSGRVSFC